jgi:hypothetical protein
MRSGQTAKFLAIAVAFFVIGMAAPAVGQRVERVLFASNADKVDGKHAVGAKATVDARKKKLVATSRQGYLPNNIIKQAPDSAKLGGKAAGAYMSDWEYVRGANVSLDIGEYGSAVATCPAGKYIVSANFTTTDGIPDSPTVFRSIINEDQTSVGFTAVNNTASNNRQFWAWAICARV